MLLIQEESQGRCRLCSLPQTNRDGCSWNVNKKILWIKRSWAEPKVHFLGICWLVIWLWRRGSWVLQYAFMGGWVWNKEAVEFYNMLIRGSRAQGRSVSNWIIYWNEPENSTDVKTGSTMPTDLRTFRRTILGDIFSFCFIPCQKFHGA